MRKVVVGMSGGVDSSVTAYLLKEDGFEVEGVSFILWEARDRRNFAACCSFEATQSAAMTAESIGLRHTEVDVRAAFIDKVIEPFAAAYEQGLTPNPCILCNRNIKFPYLLEEARRRNAGYIATGHYARAVTGKAGSDTLLKKGIDNGKDQSYVLYMLRREEIDRLLLPLGSLTKKGVREIARSLHLPASERPESQEICFVGKEGYAKFIGELAPSSCRPGPIMDSDGHTLGLHKGICHYTIGQRKGLGISSPNPYYVTEIDPLSNLVRVGTREDVLLKEIVVSDLNWLTAPPSSAFRAAVKIRSMMEAVAATIELVDRNASVRFDEPQWAPAPGQSAVFYLGDTVVGGGIIKRLSELPSSNLYPV